MAPQNLHYYADTNECPQTCQNSSWANQCLTSMHSEKLKLHRVLTFLNAIFVVGSDIVNTNAITRKVPTLIK